MCGIYGIVGENKRLVERVLRGLELLEYRGYDSFGIGARVEENGESRVFVERFLGAPSLLSDNIQYRKRFEKLHEKTDGSFLAMGHTRWATHGGVVEKNAHPQRDAHERVFVVLNGIIDNYAELRSFLEKKQSIVFRSETDTEVIPQLIGFFMEKEKMSFEDAARKTAIKLTGRFAFVAFEKDSDFLLCFRNGSTLVVGRSTEECFVSSDPSAFGNGVDRAYFLESGEYARIEKNSVRIGLFKDGSYVSRNFTQLGNITEMATKEGHPHFMLKEIMEQKDALFRAVNQDKAIFTTAAETIRSAKGPYFVACGTAANVSQIANEWMAKIAGICGHFSPASQFDRFLPFIDKDSILIAVSQSGETADILEVAEKVLKKGAKIISIVNVETSSLARMSQHVLPIKAGAEIGVAATKTALCQLAVLYLLACAVRGDMESGKSVLSVARHAIGGELAPEYMENIKNISAKFAKSEHLYVLGRGSMYPLALEGALKIKEISYIHAEGFDAGELKHGPIALIEKGTPVLALVPHDETKADMLNNLSEIRARGAKVIGISSTHHPFFDEWIPITDAEGATPLVVLIPLQMLAYSLAVLRKKNPDKPRNLAKSVTVK